MAQGQTVAAGSGVPRNAGNPTGTSPVTAEASGAPTFRVPLGPLGYQVPGKALPTEPSPADQIHFLDADHVLFTFKRPMLFERLKGGLSGDEDRNIRAVVIALPSGQREATAEWRLHDHGPYLWPLEGGRFLLRVRNRLFLTDKTLALEPFLAPVSHIESVQVSPDGRTVVLETEVERHAPKMHKDLTAQALASGAPLPAEDVRVLVVRVATRTVIAESRETRPVEISAFRNGWVETGAGRSGQWTLQYAPFGGKPKPIGTFGSKCEPLTGVLNPETILLTACPSAEGVRGAVALSTSGKRLWSVAPDRQLVLPQLTPSAQGNALMLSRLRLAGAVNGWVPLVHDEEVTGQEIEVLDARDGTVRLRAAAYPVQGYGRNYALSPDGRRFAVLDHGALAVYDLAGPGKPPAPPVEPLEMAANEAPFTRYHEFHRQARPLTEADIDLAAAPPAFVTEASDTAAAVGGSAPGQAPLFGSAATVPALGTREAAPQPTQAAAAGSETGTGQPASMAGKMVLHSSTNLVLVDVTITDKKGNAIQGIDRSRFHLVEDGHEQKISYFEEAQPTQSTMLGKANATGALPPNVYSNLPKFPPTGAVNVVLLDALNTPIANQADVHRQVMQYLSHMPPGPTVAVFALNGQLQLVQGFTTDPGQLKEAMASKAAAPRPSVALDNGLADASEGMANHIKANLASVIANNPQYDFTSMDFQAAADVRSAANDKQTQFTLGALQQLARYLYAIPGRKNLIWFSASFPLEAQPDYTLREPTKNQRENGEVVEQTSRLLAQARVAVYPIYVLGPTQTPSISATYNFNDSRAAGLGGNVFQTDDARLADDLRNNQDSLRRIAEQTGGHYVNTNDFKQALGSAISNGSSYYTLGYVPSTKKVDGHFRAIRVNVDNAAYTLSYRRGYFAGHATKGVTESLQRLNAIQSSTVPGAPPSTQIAFLARVLPVTDPTFAGATLPQESGGDGAANMKGPVRRYLVDLAVDPHGIRFEEMPNGRRQNELEYYVVVYDEKGKRLNYLDRGIRLELNQEQYERVMAANVVHRVAMDLPRGACSVRIVVYEPASSRIGSMEVPVGSESGVTTATR